MRILLGVTGSVAAFKAAGLASELVQDGHEVRVILTAGGARFVSTVTFQAITANPVLADIWEEHPDGSRMGHIELARWADVLVIAPASANSIARIALGLSDDLLGAVALSCTAPLVVAPAMESHMYEHRATQQHLNTLKSRGAHVVGPESGRLASGAQGSGRMSEPAAIRRRLTEVVARPQDFAGCSVLITAGPTYEPIDPVRFLGNRSSGKMGYAIASAAAARGAKICLVSGPVTVPAPRGGEVVPVETAAEMHRAVMDRAASAHVIILAAAVADFTPETPAREKLKRGGGLTLRLSATADIAAATAEAAPSAFRVGFALETEELLDHARAKLSRKKLDLIVANEVSDTFSPFGSDRNRVAFVTVHQVEELPELSKQEVADRLLDAILSGLRARSSLSGEGAPRS